MIPAHPLIRELRPDEYGFDYGLALAELLRHFSYEQIAGFLGYRSKASISKLMSGAIPDHPRGERLYILYFEFFGRKPPAKHFPK